MVRRPMVRFQRCRSRVRTTAEIDDIRFGPAQAVALRESAVGQDTAGIGLAQNLEQARRTVGEEADHPSKGSETTPGPAPPAPLPVPARRFPTHSTYAEVQRP